MNLDAQEGMERSVDGASFSATGGTKWARHRMGRKDYTLLWNGEVYLEWHLAIMCRDASKRIRFGQCFRKVRFVVVCRLEL